MANKSITALSMILIATFTLVVGAQHAEAGFFKWLKTEAIPTVTFERPLDVKPYLKLTHNGKTVVAIDPSNDRLEISIGGVTVQTSQLKKRLEQIGCVIEVVASEGTMPLCLLGQVEEVAQQINQERIVEAEKKQMEIQMKIESEGYTEDGVYHHAK